ncbi:hypothetical protein QO002_005174 [Pararhizobium capsulatum DSM 1112]|uniref:Lanthionine synthetase C-like protein n=1 Tax=Pararhizobium capsulatum DSM 1112 TaxID=1121113 RepID=A0ABU0BXG7_9HYPH|nr:hypothetical protein [Pararhizobium capsulatum]MDQ0322968.1 hypothetical protein [Pararhizobium capsulatum DSM 1112]
MTLLDRTAVSPTYGCFDRSYWHYRMLDFPCGMSQEFVLPLALVWSMQELPDNPYRGDPQIREWIEAGLRYAARAAHPDGSCDDYYPFERAAGAAAFSLFAILRAAEILDMPADTELDRFMILRSRWLAEHVESGRLSNHEALIVSCLESAHRRFPTEGFEAAMHQRLKRLLSWQHAEGWFDEYGGADLGYLSLTIGLLADLDRRRPELSLRAPLAAAIGFLAHFVHPDGTVGGEYSSRSTLNFFPFGFEIAAAWSAEARAVSQEVMRPLIENRTPCYSDDRIIGHHLWAWLLTLQNVCADPCAAAELPSGRRWFEGCGLLVDREGENMLVAALARGGVYKYFSGGKLAVSDTGVTLRRRSDGKTAVTHLGGSVTAVNGSSLASSGPMSFAKGALLTPLKNVVLRLIMLSLGRFFPDLIRRMLQRVLVTGKNDAPYRYDRRFEKTQRGWTVRDAITSADGWSDVGLIGISGHQTSITTIMARVYQQDQLACFIALTDELVGLDANTPLIFERRLSAT